jgi:hypothetical protein
VFENTVEVLDLTLQLVIEDPGADTVGVIAGDLKPQSGREGAAEPPATAPVVEPKTEPPD